MKLGLLLLPLVPLSALGIVEIADTLQSSTDTVCVMPEPAKRVSEPAKLVQPHVAPRSTELAPGPTPTVSL